MNTGMKAYLLAAGVVLVGLALADWRGWAPHNCSDYYRGDGWQAEPGNFRECITPHHHRRAHSLRSHHYHGGK